MLVDAAHQHFALVGKWLKRQWESEFTMAVGKLSSFARTPLYSPYSSVCTLVQRSTNDIVYLSTPPPFPPLSRSSSHETHLALASSTLRHENAECLLCLRLCVWSAAAAALNLKQCNVGRCVDVWCNWRPVCFELLKMRCVVVLTSQPSVCGDSCIPRRRLASAVQPMPSRPRKVLCFFDRVSVELTLCIACRGKCVICWLTASRWQQEASHLRGTVIW